MDELIGQAKKAAEKLKPFSGTIRVFGQYDADGITATSIFVKAMLREGKKLHVTILKQLTEANQKRVLESSEKVIVFLDFGSGQLDFLNTLKDKQIIIVDHHQLQGRPEENIVQINPLDFGITKNISSSGASYLLAKTIDNSNKDLSELAIIGAIGDSQAETTENGWGLEGINKMILNDAVEAHKVSVHKGLRLWGRTTRAMHKALEYSIDSYIPGISGSETGSVSFLQELGIQLKKENGEWRTLSDLSVEEQKKLASGIIAQRIHGNRQNPEWIFGDVYEFLDRPEEFRDAAEFATMLNACGKMGKPYLGVQLCIGNSNVSWKVTDLLDNYRKKIGSAVSWIGQNREKIKKETDHGLYLIAGDRISEHIISNVISIIHKNNGVSKPILGFAVSEEGFKISARATDEEVAGGINLKLIMETASKEVGGEGGGHAAAAGASIPAESLEAFIGKVDNLLNEVKNIKINNEHKEITMELGNLKLTSYAKTGSEEIGTKREGEGKDAGGEGPKTSRESAAYKSGSAKKMERKGLVCYLST